MSRTNEMTKGNIFLVLLKMAWPLMLINLINTFYSLVDTYFVGQIDEMKVGAISLVSPIIACGNAFANGLTAAALALISQSIGSNQREKANHIATLLIKLSIGMGILVAGFCILFAPSILNWLKTPSDIYQDTYWYLIGISFDCLFLFIIQMYQSIRQANGDSLSGVKINTFSSILNIILDPIFIFYFHLGIFGAALATVCSKVIVMPLVFYSLLTDHQSTHIDLVQYRFQPQLTKQIFITALPASIGYFISDFGFVIMNKQIVSYGSAVISGYGIGNRISSVFYIPLNAIGTALTPLIGQNLGAKEYERTKKCFHITMGCTAFVSLVSTIIGFIFTKPLVHFFIKDASELVVFEACRYAYYSISTAFFMGWFNNLSAIFIGSGNTKYSLFVNVLRLWGLRIPLIYLFERFTHLQQVGIWWAMILSNLIVCLIGQIWYLGPFNRKLQAEQKQAILGGNNND